MSGFEGVGEEQPQPDRQLWVCDKPQCGGELVYPLDWQEKDAEHWQLILRCPDCHDVREEVCTNYETEHLNEALDQAAASILHGLENLRRANMEEDVEFFVKALHADIITPADF